MIRLKEITKDNLIPVTDLEMEDSQKGFVEDNLFSIAECYLYKEFIPKAIYDDETSIGCVELIHYPDNDRAAAVYQKAGFQLTGASVKSVPGRIERDSRDENRTYEVVRRRYY